MLLRFGHRYHVADLGDLAVGLGVVGLNGHVADLLQTQAQSGSDLLLAAAGQAANQLDGNSSSSGSLLGGSLLSGSLFTLSLLGSGLLGGGGLLSRSLLGCRLLLSSLGGYYLLLGLCDGWLPP